MSNILRCILIITAAVILLMQPIYAAEPVQLDSYNLICANKDQFKYVDLPFVTIASETAGNTLGVKLDYDIQNNYIYTVEIEITDNFGLHTHYYYNQSLRIFALNNVNFEANKYYDISLFKTKNSNGTEYIKYTSSDISVTENIIKAKIKFRISDHAINLSEADNGIIMIFNNSAPDPVYGQYQLSITKLSVTAEKDSSINGAYTVTSFIFDQIGGVVKAVITQPLLLAGVGIMIAGAAAGLGKRICGKNK